MAVSYVLRQLEAAKKAARNPATRAAIDAARGGDGSLLGRDGAVTPAEAARTVTSDAGAVAGINAAAQRRRAAEEGGRAGASPTEIAQSMAGDTGAVDAITNLPETKAANDAAKAAAGAPADTYGAVLRELARARTQKMIRDTNGRSGSLLGIGTGDQATYAGGIASNARITPDGSGLNHQRELGSNRTNNYRVPAYARLSRLGIGLTATRGLGGRR
jgi:hypothetical protein